MVAPFVLWIRGVQEAPTQEEGPPPAQGPGKVLGRPRTGLCSGPQLCGPAESGHPTGGRPSC